MPFNAAFLFRDLVYNSIIHSKNAFRNYSQTLKHLIYNQSLGKTFAIGHENFLEHWRSAQLYVQQEFL
jgi:hypothetical protein